MVDSQLRDAIPTFEKRPASEAGEVDLSNWAALTSGSGIRTWAEVMAIGLVAVVIITATHRLGTNLSTKFGVVANALT